MDVAEAMNFAVTISKELQMTDLDEEFLKKAFGAASGQLNPLVAAMGGILAQVFQSSVFPAIFYHYFYDWKKKEKSLIVFF